MSIVKLVAKKVRSVVYGVFPQKLLYDRFKWEYGRRINRNHPVLFDEKIILLMLKEYSKDIRVIRCVDKGEIHSYYSEKGMESILNEMIGLYHNVEDIPWEELPDKFALKCTHGAGCNIFVSDKNTADKEAIKRKLIEWQKMDFSTLYGGIQYRHLKHDILCEKLLETADGKPPTDYKFYCIHGHVECIEVIMDRFDNYHYYLVDRDYKILPFGKGAIKDQSFADKEKPEIYTDMLELAEKLSSEFPFVRVDLYAFNGKPMLGEMTFLPLDGINLFFEDEGQRYLGDKL